MNADMQSVEELIQILHDVSAHLAEAAPPPFKAADRAKVGLPALGLPKLKTRTGATPPPLPKAKPQPIKAKEAPKSKPAKHSYGTGGLGITRSFASTTATGGKGKNTTKDNVARLSKVVMGRAAKGESLSDSADLIRDLIGEGGGSRATKADRQEKHMTKIQDSPKGLPRWAHGALPGGNKKHILRNAEKSSGYDALAHRGKSFGKFGNKDINPSLANRIKGKI